jgi:catechol 2,3-dioxygenase-like lactoylglutathione lyase family enzyme
MIRGINGIHHIAISVDDIAQAEAFYVDSLGFRVADRDEFVASTLGDRITGLNNSSAKILMIDAGNVYFAVFQFLLPQPAGYDGDRPVCDFGYTHIAQDVDPQHVESVYHELQAAGVRWHHPPSCDVADDLIMTYGRDPFGSVIELQALDPDYGVQFSRLTRWREQPQ